MKVIYTSNLKKYTFLPPVKMFCIVSNNTYYLFFIFYTNN